MSHDIHNNKPTDDGDVVYESDATDSEVSIDIAAKYTTKLKKLSEELESCKKEKQEYLDGWQRAKADFINFKKRSEEEKKEYTKFANETLLSEIITVLESFDMAFMNKEQWHAVPENWRVGVEYIHVQLVKILEENGLKEVVPKQGDVFDPNLHIADELASVSEKKQDHTILSVKKKGYALHGKILVPPKVVVGEYKDLV